MQKPNTKSTAAAGAPTVSVILPGALLTLFPGSQSHVALQAGDVGAALDALDERWPGMRDRLRDTRPAIRKHINIFVDGKRASLDTPLREDSKIYVLTAMSGG